MTYRVNTDSVNTILDWIIIEIKNSSSEVFFSENLERRKKISRKLKILPSFLSSFLVKRIGSRLDKKMAFQGIVPEEERSL